MEENEWQAVTKTKLIAFAVGVGLFLLLLLRSEAGFIPVLDHANLLFHEAGHPLVGLFSTRLEPYGGTVGQLAFPVILIVKFWRKRQTLSLACSSIWFFENWFNISRYMADARKLELPLLGGGDHDWNTILQRWDILQFDTRIADTLSIIGWSGIIVTCACVVWRAWMDRDRLVGEPDYPSTM